VSKVKSVKHGKYDVTGVEKIKKSNYSSNRLKERGSALKKQQLNTRRLTTSILSSTIKKLFSLYAWELESLKHGKCAVTVLEPGRKRKGGSNRDEARRSAQKML